MSIQNSVSRLRCNLCRRGLMNRFDLYRMDTGAFGAVGTPVLYDCVDGYFYDKNTRYSAEVLEIAGNLTGQIMHSCRMLVFENKGQADDLFHIDDTWYRVSVIRVILGALRILELEVYHYADSGGN